MSPRPQIGPRFQRVLAMVPWIYAHQGVSVAELSERFGVSLAELDRDLSLLPFCGLPPYSPDRLIETNYDGKHISIRFAEYLERPLKLTPAEGVSLLAAGRTLLAVPGSDPQGPLASALEKLEVALGARGAIAVDVAGPKYLAILRQATVDSARVEIEYWSQGRDVVSTREIEPTRIFHEFGEWYLAAFCLVANDERLFRIDRIRSVRPTGERFESRASQDVNDLGEWVGSRAGFHGADVGTRVVILLKSSALWVLDTLPCETIAKLDDGSTRVEIIVTEEPWLARLLLQLGDGAVLEAPQEWKEIGTDLARSVLDKYLPEIDTCQDEPI